MATQGFRGNFGMLEALKFYVGDQFSGETTFCATQILADNDRSFSCCYPVTIHWTYYLLEVAKMSGDEAELHHQAKCTLLAASELI